ncbi:MAG: S8 family peptidase [Nocardioidaceae bacterium]
MAKVDVLVEVEMDEDSALSRFTAACTSLDAGQRAVEDLLPSDVRGAITHRPTAKPIPMFASPPDAATPSQLSALSAFSTPNESDDVPSASEVVAVQAEASVLEDLRSRPGVTVWPNSAITLFNVDCAPFRPGVSVDVIQEQLDLADAWASGHRGKGVVVGIVDSGIDGTEYPVAGGFDRAGGQAPGAAAIDSHGSMCAADVLVAAPDATLYDYPFLGQRSSSALAMFSAVLEQRRRDGTPHVVNNSWGFVAVPTQDDDPANEIWNIEHPLHRKIREVIVSGAPVLFAAGNCGEPCPSGNCHESSVGPGISIHGSNSLDEVITVAAVNSDGDRIGYSSQGPGMFAQQKPDIAAYSHFFGNFGPGRPAGLAQPFDNGTSAACPVASGVVALMLSAFPSAPPAVLREALVGVNDGEWSPDTGHGIIHAGASMERMEGMLRGAALAD